MKSIVTWLINPHASITDLGIRWRTQLMMAFSLIIVLGVLGPLAFGRNESMERNTILWGLILMALLAYILGRTRHHHWGAILLVFGLATNGFILVLTGQSNNPAAALNTTLPLVLVVGSSLLSLRGLFFLTLFSGIGPMFLPMITNHVAPEDGMLRNGGIFLVMGLLLLGITILRDEIEKKRLSELRAANQALQVFQATLEERVNERTAQAEQARIEAEAARLLTERQAWFTKGQAQLAEKMRGEQSIEMLANNIVGQLCKYLGAQTGALFLSDGKKIKLTGRYAYVGNAHQKNEFNFDENLPGEAIRENRMISLSNIEDMPLISSSLGTTQPKELLLAPIGTDQQAIGVVELATLNTFSEDHQLFLRQNAESIAIAFNTAQTRERIAALLIESQQQSEELQAQEEELRAANEALMAQAENRNLYGNH